ncbi:response regulator, partial [Rhodanobacter sp. Si-c]
MGIDLGIVLIVEDDTTAQQRLARLLAELAGKHVHVSFVASISAAKAWLASSKPDVVLIDIRLPDGSGIELIAWLHEHHPRIATVAISAWGEQTTVLAALRAGAVGYLLKERKDAELSLALQSIRRGGALIDPFVARRILESLPLDTVRPKFRHAPHHSSGALSKREAEILR